MLSARDEKLEEILSPRQTPGTPVENRIDGIRAKIRSMEESSGFFTIQSGSSSMASFSRERGARHHDYHNDDKEIYTPSPNRDQIRDRTRRSRDVDRSRKTRDDEHRRRRSSSRSRSKSRKARSRSHHRGRDDRDRSESRKRKGSRSQSRKRRSRRDHSTANRRRRDTSRERSRTHSVSRGDHYQKSRDYTREASPRSLQRLSDRNQSKYGDSSDHRRSSNSRRNGDVDRRGSSRPRNSKSSSSKIDLKLIVKQALEQELAKHSSRVRQKLKDDYAGSHSRVRRSDSISGRRPSTKHLKKGDGHDSRLEHSPSKSRKRDLLSENRENLLKRSSSMTGEIGSANYTQGSTLLGRRPSTKHLKKGDGHESRPETSSSKGKKRDVLSENREDLLKRSSSMTGEIGSAQDNRRNSLLGKRPSSKHLKKSDGHESRPETSSSKGRKRDVLSENQLKHSSSMSNEIWSVKDIRHGFSRSKSLRDPTSFQDSTNGEHSHRVTKKSTSPKKKGSRSSKQKALGSEPSVKPGSVAIHTNNAHRRNEMLRSLEHDYRMAQALKETEEKNERMRQELEQLKDRFANARINADTEMEVTRRDLVQPREEFGKTDEAPQDDGMQQHNKKERSEEISNKVVKRQPSGTDLTQRGQKLEPGDATSNSTLEDASTSLSTETETETEENGAQPEDVQSDGEDESTNELTPVIVATNTQKHEVQTTAVAELEMDA